MGQLMDLPATALAVLLLTASGCAMTEEVSPERAEVLSRAMPETAVPAPEAALDEGDIVEQDEAHWAEALRVEEPRAPLKDVLKEQGASLPKQAKHVVKAGDTLGEIAEQYDVTISMLKSANKLKSDRVRIGQKLTIPSSALRIEIDKSENKLRLYNGTLLARAYPVATGDQGVTPIGSYTIANRLIGPTWYWEGRAYPKDDPEYPLGSRWMGLSRRGYGIHGTNEPELIGQQVSHGCIRMLNEDVEELFDVVAEGTPVSIIE